MLNFGENAEKSTEYDLTKKKIFYNNLASKMFVFCALILAVIVFSIIIFVGKQGLKTFLEISPVEFFFSSRWDPFENDFGALSFISGSVFVTLLASLFGAPLGVAGAVFMAKIAPKKLFEFMKPAIGLYMAIPSVVYGYIGLTVIVPFVHDVFNVSSGFGLFTASFILGIMILPTIISISVDAIKSVDKSLEEASLAMGATRWQTIWHITLPAAKSGILTAVILGMARAIGETMAVQMVIGNAPKIATSLFTPTSTLPSEIALEMGNTPFDSAWGNSLFLMAFVLLLISIIMIISIRKITESKV